MASVDLKSIVDRLRDSVPRYAIEYAVARERQPALAPYPTALTALEALRSVSELGHLHRGALLLAIVEEQQMSPHPLWQAMLVCAFGPMLRRLSAKLGCWPREDRAQEALVHFLEAVKALPKLDKPSFTEIALRRATARSAFRAARMEKEARSAEPFDEETYPSDPFACAIQKAIVDASAAEAAAVIERGGIGADLLPVMLATFVGEESLRAYVNRNFAGLSEAARAAEYDRLRSARRRLRARVRAAQGLA